MRTWPLYFLGLLCYMVYYKYFDINVIYYFVFLQNMFQPIISDHFYSVSWSLVIEEYFYLLYPLIFVFFYYLFKINSINCNKKYLVFVSCFFILLLCTLIRFTIDTELHNWGKEIRRVGIFRLDSIAYGGLAAFFYPYFKNIKYFRIFITIILITSFLTIFYFLNNYLLTNSFDEHLGKNYIFYLQRTISCS